MLQLKDIEDIMKSATTIEEVRNDDLDLLINCVNLVSNAIATDYIPLVKTKNINNATGTIDFAKIASEPIYKILRIKDRFGEKVPYKIVSDGIVCQKGDVEVVYSYFPSECGVNDIIDDFHTDLTERVFAMGVVSEFLFIRGNSDDAAIWEGRFKTAMRNIIMPRKEVVMHKRRWW